MALAIGGVVLVVLLIVRVAVVMRRDWRESETVSRAWHVDQQRNRRDDDV